VLTALVRTLADGLALRGGRSDFLRGPLLQCLDRGILRRSGRLLLRRFAEGRLRLAGGGLVLGGAGGGGQNQNDGRWNGDQGGHAHVQTPWVLRGNSTLVTNHADRPVPRSRSH